MPRGVYVRKPRGVTPYRIRNLRPDEPRPEGEPRRFPDRAGYIRLRWKVGIRSYVEVREHRHVVGAAPGEHVHHRNRGKADNRPENLERLTPAAHASHHAAELRKVDVSEAIRLYDAGHSTTQIGRMQGVHGSNVWRALHRAGYRMRAPGERWKTEHGREARPLLLAYLAGVGA